MLVAVGGWPGGRAVGYAFWPSIAAVGRARTAARRLLQAPAEPLVQLAGTRAVVLGDDDEGAGTLCCTHAQAAVVGDTVGGSDDLRLWRAYAQMELRMGQEVRALE